MCDESKKEELRAEFDRRVRQAAQESISYGYRPTRMLDMLERQRADAVACELVVNSDIQKGFREMISRNLRHLTIESIMLEDPFRCLFERKHLEAAQWRLDNAHHGGSRE